MASGTVAGKSASGPSSGDRPIDQFEALIDDRIKQTRRQLKTVDLAEALIALVAVVLGYLFLSALLDHWLVAGGLGFAGRLGLFAGLAALVVLLVVRNVGPLIYYRINPVFAASVLEQTRPSLKNSLINFLFLRGEANNGNRDELARGVFYGLERRTAAEVAQIPSEIAVDRAAVVRRGIALVVVFAAICLYLVLSPKNPIASFGRVLWPWAPIPTPTRVTIDDVRPGNTAQYQGETVSISATVNGVRRGEAVLLHYTSSDGRSVNQVVPMAIPTGSYRYEGQLPPGKAGLQQDLRYWIAAGDFKTPSYQLRAETPLAIVVDSVTYEFPAYTGLPSETRRQSGDLRAVEGTRAVIDAVASEKINWAAIELDDDPRRRTRMKVSGNRAVGELLLAMDRQQPLKPAYSSYQLRFAEGTSGERRENRNPARYLVEVMPDLAPRAQILRPVATKVELPVGDQLDLVIRAEDPDFALRRVLLRLEHDARSLNVAPLLEKAKDAPAHAGPLEKTFRFSPADFGLTAGARVLAWVEAFDNKEPLHNRTESSKLEILIVAQPSTKPIGSATSNPQGDDSREPHEGGERPNSSESSSTPSNNDPAANTPPTGDGKGKVDDGAADGRVQKPQDEPPGSATGDSQQQEGQQGSQQQGSQQQGSQQQGEQQQGEQQQGEQQQGEQQQGEQQQDGQNQSSSARGNSSQTGAASAAPPTEPAGASEGSEQAAGQEQKAPAKDSKATRRDEPLDGQTNPGDVFDEVLRHREEHSEQKAGQNPASSPDSQPKPAASETPPEGQPNQQGSSQDATGEQRPANASEQPADNPDDPSARQEDQQGKQAQDDSGAAKEPAAESGQPSSGSPSQETSSAPREPSPADPSAKKPAPSDQPPSDQPPSNQSPGGEGQPSQQPSGDQSSQPEGSKPSGSGSESSAKPSSAGQEPSGGKRTPQTSGQPSPSGTEQPSDPAKQPGSSEKPPDTAPPQAPSGAAPQPDSQGGAGRAAEGANPVPSAQGANQPREGAQGQEPQKPSQQGAESPATTSTSPQQSKSNAPEDDDGTLSGGGGEGGGQGAQQSGAGGAGSQKSADTGGGASQEPGAGELSQQPGGEKNSSSSGGSSGESQAGGAPGQSAGNSGNEPQDVAPSGSNDRKPPATQPPNPEENAAKGSSSGDSPQGGGAAGGGQASMGSSGGKEAAAGSGNSLGAGAEGQGDTSARPKDMTDGSDPNLEYADKATNLALEYLEDQLAQESPDPALLDRLGWNREELDAFVRQWQRMKTEAKEQGPRGAEAQKNLSSALRSLGLRRTGTELRGGDAPGDQARQIESRRFDPPPQWEAIFRAYSEGVGSRPATGR